MDTIRRSGLITIFKRSGEIYGRYNRNYLLFDDSTIRMLFSRGCRFISSSGRLNREEVERISRHNRERLKGKERSDGRI